jgi:hypothetical protein
VIKLYFCRMKQIATLFILLTLAFSEVALAQKSNEETPVKRERTDMFMIQYNHEGLLNFPDSIRLSPWSRGVGISFMYDHFLVESDKLSIGIGLSFYSHNYLTKSDITQYQDTSGQVLSKFTAYSPYTINRSKIVRNFLDIPVELRYRTTPNEKGHSWKVAVGAKIGYRTNIYSKVIDKNDDKYKSFIYPQVSRSRYGLTGRIGYGKVSVNGYYSLSNFFFEGRGAEITPISLGVTLTLF